MANTNITHFVKTAKGGVLYKDATGAVIGAGSPMDRAAPDVTNEFGIIIFSGSNDNTYYSVANAAIEITIETPDGTSTSQPNRNELLTILAESFFFLASGGGGSGIIDVNNGLSPDGTTGQLGGTLIKDTVIDEADFQMLRYRTATLNLDPLSVADLTEKADFFDTGDLGLFRGQYVQDTQGGRAFSGVFGDNTNDSVAFIKSGLGDYSASAEARYTGVLLRVLNLGIIESSWSLQGNAITAACDRAEFFATSAIRFFTDKVEQQLTGKYIFGESSTTGSFRIGVGSEGFIIEKFNGSTWVLLNGFNESARVEKINANTNLIKLPVLLNVTGTAATDLVTFAMSNESQAAFNMNVNIKKTGVAGGGYIQSVGSASRNAGGIISLNTANPNSVTQESITGNYTISMAAVSGDFVIRIAQSNAVKSRIEGFIEFLVTNIPDTF